MRGKVAKNLRKFAKRYNPDVPWVNYGWVDPTVMLEHKEPEDMNRSTLVLVDCQKVEYKFLKTVYKETL